MTAGHHEEFDSTAQRWPKRPPRLTPQQEQAREAFMVAWHQVLPSGYAAVERFNHGYVSRLPITNGSTTLEIGAGLGAHSKFEDLTRQDYYCLEYREDFCRELRKLFPIDRVRCGDIEQRQAWPDGFFDRIVGVHVLEHLRNLPAALIEIHRLLKPDGCFDVVLPCEAGWRMRLPARYLRSGSSGNGLTWTTRRSFRTNMSARSTRSSTNSIVSSRVEPGASFRCACRSRP